MTGVNFLFLLISIIYIYANIILPQAVRNSAFSSLTPSPPSSNTKINWTSYGKEFQINPKIELSFTNLKVPMDYQNPNGPNIDLNIKRTCKMEKNRIKKGSSYNPKLNIVFTVSKSNSMLVEERVKNLISNSSDFDSYCIYQINLRGTGSSKNILGINDNLILKSNEDSSNDRNDINDRQKNEESSLIKRLYSNVDFSIKSLTINNAALDLIFFIKLLKGGIGQLDMKISFYGISLDTLIVQRAMTLDSQLFDGNSQIILDDPIIDPSFSSSKKSPFPFHYNLESDENIMNVLLKANMKNPHHLCNVISHVFNNPHLNSCTKILHDHIGEANWKNCNEIYRYLNEFSNQDMILIVSNLWSCSHVQEFKNLLLLKEKKNEGKETNNSLSFNLNSLLNIIKMKNGKIDNDMLVELYIYLNELFDPSQVYSNLNCSVKCPIGLTNKCFQNSHLMNIYSKFKNYLSERNIKFPSLPIKIDSKVYIIQSMINNDNSQPIRNTLQIMNNIQSTKSKDLFIIFNGERIEMEKCEKFMLRYFFIFGESKSKVDSCLDRLNQITLSKFKMIQNIGLPLAPDLDVSLANSEINEIYSLDSIIDNLNNEKKQFWIVFSTLVITLLIFNIFNVIRIF